MLIGAGLRVGFQEMMQHMQQHHNVLFVLALLCLSCAGHDVVIAIDGRDVLLVRGPKV
jgi:hypothetical protein